MRCSPWLDGFSDGADPEADLELLQLEGIAADRDHVARRRLEKVHKDAKSGDPAGSARRPRLTEELLAHLEGGERRSLGVVGRPPGRARAADDAAGDSGRERARRASIQASRWSSRSFDPEEAAEFRAGPSALDEIVGRLKEALDLITFFTIGDTEARAWTLKYGETALDAAEALFTRISRGGASARRGHPLGQPVGERVARGGRPARAAAARGKDLRRRGRGRGQHPLQRLRSSTPPRRALRRRGRRRRRPAGTQLSRSSSRSRASTTVTTG